MTMIRLFLICGLVTIFSSPVFSAENTNSPEKKQTTAAEEKHSEEQAVAEKQLRFSIFEFQINGNHVLEKNIVERSVYPFLGRDKTIDDVNAASTALQTLYKTNGYPTVLVDIPEQDVSKGIVKLNVIEGKIDRLKITDAKYFSLKKIREFVPELAKGTVPHLPTVQEQLKVLNSTNPDLRVTPIFRPGRLPGTVAVELRVKDKAPLHASLELNGRNSIGTTRTRLIANVSYNNLWLKNHSLSLTYQMSPENTKEVRVLVGSYMMPLGSNGDRLAMYAVKSDSETGVSSGGALSVVGKGTVAGARWVKSLKGENKYFHSIVFGMDYKNFDEVVALVGTDSIVTPISYTMFSIDYNATAISLSGTTTFTSSVKFSPRAFGNNTTEFENKRFDAKPNFSIIEANLLQTYRFDNGIKLHATIAGQFAGQPLVSNEQYSVGGAETVRGYYESQVLADDAARASIEILGPNLKMLNKRGFKDAYALAFAEGAATRIHKPIAGTDDREEISSIGIGLRMATKKSVQLSLDVASALKDNKIVEKGDIRIHFQLRGTF